MSEREILGLDPASDGVWVLVDGEVRLVRYDPLASAERIKREVLEAQKAWALKNFRAAGRESA